MANGKKEYLRQSGFAVYSLPTNEDKHIVNQKNILLASMTELTPVERIGELYFKREDKYAPNGLSSVNGSKLRQCVHLINDYAYQRGKTGVVSGAVTGSPQHPMVTYVARAFGLRSVIFVGAKDVQQYEYLRLAREMGAEFMKTNIGYAQALNAKSRKMSEMDVSLFHLETNITLDERKNSAAKVSAFHDVGGLQVANIPRGIDTILIPAGSCNSATSILHGLAKHGYKGVRQVVLFGIGNYGSKAPRYIRTRLSYMSRANGIDYKKIFCFSEFENHPAPVEVVRFDINGSGFAKYEDLMPAHYRGIDFHPRYEGKVWNYIEKNPQLQTFLTPRTLFWIVGSAPK